MKKKVLVDLEVICDSPNYILWGNLEHQERQLELWAKDFNEFIRDHRSQDRVNLSVRRVYKEECEYCHRVWEEYDDGCPVCCTKAQEEWKASKKELDLEEASRQISLDYDAG